MEYSSFLLKEARQQRPDLVEEKAV